MTLAQQLGYSSNDRLLIVNADDFGMCHATNAGIQQLLTEKAISSSTVMMPCAWSTEAVSWAAAHPEHDVGVHLTFTSEWELYKWGPVTRDSEVSSLITRSGFFPSRSLDVELKADPAEIRTEILCQIGLAKQCGLSPTHLDNHMGSLYGLQTGRDFLEIVFDICASFGLPFRMPRYYPANSNSSPELRKRSELRVSQADDKGIVILDYLLGLPFELEENETYETFRNKMGALLRNLQPGVSELIIHPSHATDELKAINPQWKKREMELQVFRDPFIQNLIASEGIRMIRWSDLRELQQNQTRAN